MLHTMLDVLFLRLRVKGLRKAIAISSKLRLRAWTALVLIFVLLLFLSIGGLVHNERRFRLSVIAYDPSTSISDNTTGALLCCVRDFAWSNFNDDRWATCDDAGSNCAWYLRVRNSGGSAIAPQVTKIVAGGQIPYARGSSVALTDTVPPLGHVSLTLTTVSSTGGTPSILYMWSSNGSSGVETQPSKTSYWMVGNEWGLHDLGNQDHPRFQLRSHKATGATQAIYIQAAREQPKQMELKILQLQQELDRAKSQPLIVPA